MTRFNGTSQNLAPTPGLIPDNELTIRECLVILKRRRWVILGACAAAMIAGAAVSVLTRPMYRSSARIVVEPRSVAMKQVDGSSPLGALNAPPGTQDVQTQLELVKDPILLERAYAKIGSSRKSVRLSARQVNDTNVIEVTAEAGDRRLAERAAAAVPAVYHQFVVQLRRAGAGQALEFSQSRLREESLALEKAENALKRFREGQRIANVERQRDARIEEQTNATSELNKAEAEVAALAQQLTAMIAIRGSEPAFVENSATSANAVVNVIRDQIAALQTERASLTVLYKSNHTSVLAIDARIKDLQDRLAREPKSTTAVTRIPNPALAVLNNKISETKAELAARRAALDRSRQQLARVDSKLTSFASWELRNARLERAVRKHEASVGLLARAVDELSLRDQANRVAEPPLMMAKAAVKIAPRPTVYMVVALLSGLMVGLMLALLWEHLDDRANTEQDVVSIMQAPILGYLPSSRSHALNRAQGGSMLLESVRMLRSSLRFASIDNPPRSLLISSSMPGEGKSFTAKNLAVAYTLDGKNVILVDADLRNPVMHERMNIPRCPGLTDVLVGDVELDQALQQTGTRGLRVLAAGTFTTNPTELLSSRRMEALMADLNEMADCVIYDGPPVTGAADAQILSGATDGVLHVVEMGRARKTGLMRSADMLYHARANVIGVVLNRADGAAAYGYYTNIPRYALASQIRALPESSPAEGTPAAS